MNDDVKINQRWAGRTRHHLNEWRKESTGQVHSILNLETRAGDGAVFLNQESWERAEKEPDFWGVRCTSPKLGGWRLLPREMVRNLIKQEGRPRQGTPEKGGPYWTLEYKDVIDAHEAWKAVRDNRTEIDNQVEDNHLESGVLTTEQRALLGFPPSYDSSPTLATLMKKCRVKRLGLSIDADGNLQIG
jgi:hypothetical protein